MWVWIRELGLALALDWAVKWRNQKDKGEGYLGSAIIGPIRLGPRGPNNRNNKKHNKNIIKPIIRTYDMIHNKDILKT